MSDISTSSSITINASADEVWAALTTPDVIKQWFFGVDTQADWKVGGTIVHSGEWQGQPYEDRGEIVKIDPPRHLVHTHWSPLSGRPDAPENYEEITWTLVERDGATELTIAEKNLPSEEARTTSEQAWGMVLSNLKDLLEK